MKSTPWLVALALTIAVPALAVDDERHEFHGTYICAATYVIITGECMMAGQFVADTVVGERIAGIQGEIDVAHEDAHVHVLRLQPGWSRLHVAVYWEGATAAPAMSFNVESPYIMDEMGHSVYRYARSVGESGVDATLLPGDAHASADVHPSQGQLAVPAGGGDVHLRVFPAGHMHNPAGTTFLGVGAGFLHHYWIVANVSY